MSLVFDLYFNTYLLEDEVDNLKNSQEIVELEKQLAEKLNGDLKIYKDIKFWLVHKLTMLMEDERELALKRGIKIGMELQEYFAELAES